MKRPLWSGLLLLAVLALTTHAGSIFDARWSERTAHVYAAWSEPVAQVYNVRSSRFGARGDGVADDWAAIQAALDTAPNSSTIYLPTGAYRITATLDFGSKVLRLQGDSQGRAAEGVTSGGSVIFGSVNGPLLKTGTGLNTGIVIEKLGFRNTHATGTGLAVTGIGLALRDLGIQAFIGIDARLNTFTLLIENVVIRPITPFALGSIGILASSHTEIIACDIVNFDHGIRAYGTTVNITGCRLEVNNTAMMLGMDETGASHQLSRSSITGNSMEANDTAVYVLNMTASKIAALGLQGSVNSPTGQSKLGIYVVSASYSEVNSVVANGSFSTAGIRVKGGVVLGFKNVVVSNAISTAQTWDVQGNLVNLSFDNCNYTQRPDDSTASAYIDYKRGLVTHYIRQIDNLNPGVEGRNIRGVGVPVAQTNTSVAVTFTGFHTTGQAVIDTATAAAGGSLAAKTYYYVATLVTSHGETGASSEKSVVVGGSNGTVKVTFFRTTADGWKRRIYRGIAPGVYDGYFETALNSSAAFSDTGQAFTGLKSPPVAQDTETDMREPDANYGVIVTPNWGTTAWVTAKATTGFTINFGTAAPASASVDWFIVR
jgi:hypothetical protein